MATGTTLREVGILPRKHGTASTPRIRNYIVDTMRAEIIRIGNSRGIRIPKAILEQCGFGDEVELEVQGKDLILHNPGKAREGWDAIFARAKKDGPEPPLDPHVATSWDEEEWEW
jgi:antitoxin MazE